MLLDISMPEMDGYELLQTMRLDPKLRLCPAIAVTAHAFEQDRLRAAQAGFSVHVAKPYDVEALLHLVERLTRKSGPTSDPPLVRDFHAVLDMQGLHEALGFLNRRSGHRFTGVYRFDGEILRNAHLFDRTDPKCERGRDVPLRDAFCSVVRAERRPLASANTFEDPRLGRHPATARVQAYSGVLLRNFDGTPFGTLCHFDPAPVPPFKEGLDALLLAAPLVAERIAPRER
jgi:CheY-like chemotaxis protein